MRTSRLLVALVAGVILPFTIAMADADPLEVGIASHAFDHLGDIADQAPAAAASGATVIYCTGFGTVGYAGWPTPDKLKAIGDTTAAYIRQARTDGVRLSIGYLCATSIVGLDSFDRNWPAEFRARFSSPPREWLQRGPEGKPLPSWYGGDYRPACMNNPDWRIYEREMVRRQLEAGCDGIFFDNPTVHAQGCYCDYCMKKFAAFLSSDAGRTDLPAVTDMESLRRFAAAHPGDFLRFRCTIAAGFLSEMRSYARTVKPAALVTCNNSLNSPELLYSQCRTYGYSINDLSKVEDLVVVEDMASLPRTLKDGTIIEYGPVYEVLQSISHHKPLVAVTLADGDYHTPSNLMRLAMAEAAAHGASYLSWPTWPQGVRQKMIAAVRPQADFLRRSADLLNETRPCLDVALFFPVRQWLGGPDCPALQAARALARANIQFKVVSEEDLAESLAADRPPALVVQSPQVLNAAESTVIDRYKHDGGHVVWSSEKNWMDQLAALSQPSVILKDGPPGIRVVLREKPHKTIVHLLNLNVERISSFDDRVHPADDVHLILRCHGDVPTSIVASSADPEATVGPIQFTVTKEADANVVQLAVPRLFISTIFVIQ